VLRETEKGDEDKKLLLADDSVPYRGDLVGA
jgi:hypothetical protein